jgi:hypothetical protein
MLILVKLDVIDLTNAVREYTVCGDEVIWIKTSKIA